MLQMCFIFYQEIKNTNLKVVIKNRNIINLLYCIKLSKLKQKETENSYQLKNFIFNPIYKTNI